MSEQISTPKQNKALQNGGGSAIGIGGLSGGMLAIFLQGIFEQWGWAFSTEWYQALGGMLIVGMQVASTFFFTDS